MKAVQAHELGHALLNLPDAQPGGEGPNQIFESAVYKEAGIKPEKKDTDGNGIVEYFKDNNADA